MNKMVAAVLAAVVAAAGLVTAPAPSAEAAPKKQCIYMVKNVQRDGGWLRLDYVVWKKRGTNIVGEIGGIPSEYERHWLTYQPKHRRAVGKQENWTWPVNSPEYYPKTYKTKGTHARPVVRGYVQVSKKRMVALTPGFRAGVPGCEA